MPPPGRWNALRARRNAALQGKKAGSASRETVEPEMPALDLQSRYGNQAVAGGLIQLPNLPSIAWDLPREGIQGPLPPGTVRQEGRMLIQQGDERHVLIEYGDASLRITAEPGGKYTYYIDPPVKKPPPERRLFEVSGEEPEAPLPQVAVRVASNSNVRVEWEPGAMQSGMPLVVHSRVTGDLETEPGLLGEVSEFGILDSGITLTLENTLIHMLGTTPEARVAYWIDPEWSGPEGLEKVVYIVASAGVLVRTGEPQWPNTRLYGRKLLPHIIRVPHPAMVPEQGEPIDPSDYIGMYNVTAKPGEAELVITPEGAQIVESPPNMEATREQLLQVAHSFTGTSLVHPESRTRITLRPADPAIGATYAWQLISPTDERPGEIRIVVGPGTVIETASPPPRSYVKEQGGSEGMLLPGSNFFADEIPNTPAETLSDSRVDLHIVEVWDPVKVPPPGTPINVNYYLGWGKQRTPDRHTWLGTSNTGFDALSTGLDVGIGMIPIIGDLVDIGEFFAALATDRDRWGRKVDAEDKMLMGLGAVIGLIPLLGGVGSLLRSARRATNTLATIAHAWGKSEEQLEVLIWRVSQTAKGEDSAAVNRIIRSMRTGEEVDPGDLSKVQRVVSDLGGNGQILTHSTGWKAVQLTSAMDDFGEPLTDPKVVGNVLERLSGTGEISPTVAVSLERSGVAQNADEAKAILEQSLRDAAQAGHASPDAVNKAVGRLDEAISDETFAPAERMGTVTFSGRMKKPREHRKRYPEVTYRRGGPLENLEPDNALVQRIDEGEQALEESIESINGTVVERGKTFAASGEGVTVSGYTFVPEREVLNITPADVRTRATELGHPVRGNKNDQGVRGQYFDSHAEKKQIVANPDQPVGVSRPMCSDCVNFFSREARARGSAQVVTDPFTTRVFEPSGTITEYWRDGSVIRIHPDGTVSTLPSTMRSGGTP